MPQAKDPEQWSPITQKQYNSDPSRDPYGYAMKHIITGLRKAQPFTNKMSVAEAAILRQIQLIIQDMDPASLEMEVLNPRPSLPPLKRQ